MGFPRRHWLFAVLACLALAASMHANAAGELGPIIFSFATPQMFDPNRVVIYFDTLPQGLAGSDLTVPSPPYPMVKGTEVHSQIPGASANTIRDITSLQISFLYDGPVSIFSGADTFPSGPAFVPWIVTGGNVSGNLYSYIFTAQPGSAPINDNFDPGPGFPTHTSFGTLTVTGAQSDLNAFIQQNPPGSIPLKPGTAGGLDRGSPAIPTPEFGSVGSLATLLAAGAAGLWIRRRRAPQLTPASRNP